ncbi:MAG: bis(5'-nucleosyl)-tetraphosphatase (symmetrical) YqeK [Gemmatimonadota bacterium]
MSARATTESSRAARAAARLERTAPLRARLSERRWRHTLSVAETAYALAEALGWTARDRGRAVTAALLHDVAKDLPQEEQLRRAGGPDPQDAGFPGLVHARAGAAVAREEFGIADAELLRAVALHPTSSADATPLGWVLFAADALEPTRRHLESADRDLLRRALAGELTLAELSHAVLARKLTWVLARGLPVHPRSVEAWNALCRGRA